MNSHEQYAALLDAFIDEALPEAESERVRAHVETCPECQAYVSDALTMRELFPGVEETLVPDGFAERVLSSLPSQDGGTQSNNGVSRTQAKHSRWRAQSQNSRTQAQNGVSRTQAKNVAWRAQWMKITLPLAACVTLVLLVGGIVRGLPTRERVTGNVTLTMAGYDTDIDGIAPENELDMDEVAPEGAEESVYVMKSAENASAADMDMDDDVASGNGMDGGAMPDSVTNGGAASGDHTNTGGAALKRAYETPEEPETEESAVFEAEITAAVPEPDESQRVSGASQRKSAAASSDDSAIEAAPDDVSMESAPESDAEESVAVSCWTLSPDAAPMLEQYPVSKETASGVWYALEPEQFDALRETLPESAFTPLDPDSLPPDDAPPLRSRAPVYLFLPLTESANP